MGQELGHVDFFENLFKIGQPELLDILQFSESLLRQFYVSKSSMSWLTQKVVDMLQFP